MLLNVYGFCKGDFCFWNKQIARNPLSLQISRGPLDGGSVFLLDLFSSVTFCCARFNVEFLFYFCVVLTVARSRSVPSAGLWGRLRCTSRETLQRRRLRSRLPICQRRSPSAAACTPRATPLTLGWRKSARFPHFSRHRIFSFSRRAREIPWY